MTYSTLLLSYEDRIATITLNRPDVRNAVSYAMIDELSRALDAVRTAGAQVPIITGAGTAFCAGMDLENLKGLRGRTQEQNVEESQKMASLFRGMRGFPLATVAA